MVVIITFVLSVLSNISFFLHHIWRATRDFCKFLFNSSRSYIINRSVIGIYSCKSVEDTVSHRQEDRFINIKNSIGSKMEPWGTPDFTLSSLSIPLLTSHIVI